MTFFKLMTTTTIVGLISTTSFADSINFTQNLEGGIISNVSFEQNGAGTNAIVANVTGDLAKLNITQSNTAGKTNTDNVTIETKVTGTSATIAGLVEIATDGEGNSSTLVVDQSNGGSLDYKVNIKGNDNTLNANIGSVNSIVHLASLGDDISYNIDQIGDDATNNHKITANIVQVEGAASSHVTLTQSGLNNTINLGTVFSENAENDDIGLKLYGGADVDIIQTADNATFT